ncbi:FYTTD1 isoform 2, partial [Pan troglodytes]
GCVAVGAKGSCVPKYRGPVCSRRDSKDTEDYDITEGIRFRDDIIKLNRKEGKKQNFPRLNRRLLQQSGAQQFRMRVRWGIQQNSDTKTLESSIVKHMKRFVLVIPALWEVRARGLLKPRTSGPAWAT